MKALFQEYQYIFIIKTQIDTIIYTLEMFNEMSNCPNVFKIVVKLILIELKYKFSEYNIPYCHSYHHKNDCTASYWTSLHY